MSVKNRLKKTTKAQYEELLNFLETNKIIIHGKTKPTETKKINHLWEEFSLKMSDPALGHPKTAEQWRKVFNEWKMNTKRKSRQIIEGLNATGGGVNGDKALTDQEERLLGLISKIHLGDHSLPDTLGGDAETEPPVVEEIYMPVNYIEEEEILNVIVPTERVPDVIKQITINSNANGSQKNSNKTSRYTNVLLENACESFAEANKISNASEKEKAGALRELAQSINTFSTIFQGKVEADMLIAKAKYNTAKAIYFQTFASLEGFME